jgi:hypothetical protein
VLVGFPSLRKMVRASRAAGLETLLDWRRLALLAAAVRCVRHVPGEVIKTGSYRGGSAALLGQMLRTSGKRLHVGFARRR